MAYVTSDRVRVELDSKRSGPIAAILRLFYSNSELFISTILVGNNIALVIYSLCMSLLLRSVASLIGWESVVREGSVLVETVVSTLILSLIHI